MDHRSCGCWTLVVPQACLRGGQVPATDIRGRLAVLMGSWLAVCAPLQLSPVRPCRPRSAEIRPRSSPEAQ